VSRGWRINLIGGFRITDPDGHEVKLPSRKAQALIALLALNRGSAMSRQQLAADLWPGRPTTMRRQNLRQAIAQVARVFSPVECISGDRDTCRLTLESWWCDATAQLDGEDIETQGELLPEMPEPVFEAWRLECTTYAPKGDWSGAISGVVQVLQWTIVHAPARSLDVLHPLQELVPCLPTSLLEDALSTALATDPNHRLRLWGTVQLAIVRMWRGIGDAGLESARLALKAADPRVNPDEWTAVAFAAAMALVFHGRFDRAHHLLAEAQRIVGELGFRQSVQRLLHADAHCYAYSGDLDRAIELLGDIEESDDVAARFREVHRIIYLAIAGRPDEARALWTGARGRSSSLQDARLDTQSLAAEGMILLAEKRFDEARAVLADLRELSVKLGIPLITIQAIESLAIVAVDEAVHAGFMNEATALRRRHRLPRLPLDEIRLSGPHPR